MRLAREFPNVPAMKAMNIRAKTVIVKRTHEVRPTLLFFSGETIYSGEFVVLSMYFDVQVFG